MVCLGCSHFYHPECFLHYLTAELQNSSHWNTSQGGGSGGSGRGSSHHIICIQCQMSQTSCACYECYHREDKSLSGEHIINENDMKLFQNLILNDKLRNIPLEEQRKVQSDIESLLQRWCEIYTNQSITSTISSINGNQLFECECGERYEVESPRRMTRGGVEKLALESQERDGVESKDGGGNSSGNVEERTNRQPTRTFLCPNPSCRRSYCAEVVCSLSSSLLTPLLSVSSAYPNLIPPPPVMKPLLRELWNSFVLSLLKMLIPSLLHLPPHQQTPHIHHLPPLLILVEWHSLFSLASIPLPIPTHFFLQHVQQEQQEQKVEQKKEMESIFNIVQIVMPHIVFQ
jgi:hypothetical protein